MYSSGPWSTRRRATSAVGGWFLAASVYFLAVLHRTSLGVAGVLAADRFHISPAQLSVFALVQIGVYALMQIPAGILADRFGARRLLVAAAVTMGLAQLSFATVDSFLAALAARAVLGCGDALTFVSVLRFAAPRFASHRYPAVVAATVLAGVCGNIAATLPITALLRDAGWTPTFALAGVLSLACGALVWWFLPADPIFPASFSVVSARRQLVQVRARVSTAWAQPGTRLGFWVHASTMSPGAVFGMLWGYPYLVQGVGLTPSTAGGMLLVDVLVGALANPVLGAILGRRPQVRVPLAVVVCLVDLASWVVLLAAPEGHPSTALLIVHMGVLGIGGAASTIAFALARDYNDPGVVGTATGIVNVGGFAVTVVAALGIGLVLDAHGTPDASAFRHAWTVVVALQVIGTIQLLRWWRRVHLRMSLRRFVPEPAVLDAIDLVPASPVGKAPMRCVARASLPVRRCR